MMGLADETVAIVMGSKNWLRWVSCDGGRCNNAGLNALGLKLGIDL